MATSLANMVASAVMNMDRVHAISVNDDEILWRRFWVYTSFTKRVAKLHSKAKVC